MIRAASPEDIPALLKLAPAFYAETIYSRFFTFNPLSAEAILRGLIDSSTSIVFMPEDATGAAAVSCASNFISGERSAVEVLWWVDPSHRRTGMKLKRCIEEWAHAEGCKTIVLSAPEDNLALQALLPRIGYHPLERVYIKVLG